MKNEISKDLLGVTICRTSASHNKILRFNYETEGTRFFVHKENGKYIFSKNYNKDSESVIVQKNTYPVFLYIPVLKIIAEEGYVSVLKKEEDYIVRKSTEDEIACKARRMHHESGDVVTGSTNGIYIQKKDYDRLYFEKWLKMHVISGKGKLYMEVSPCKKEENLPSLAEAATPYGGWEFLDRAEEYIYKRPIPTAKSQLPLPISFMRKSNLTPKDKFHTYFREDGTFIIEPHPLTCDICGKSINRYEDVAHETYICRSCKHTIPIIQKLNTSSYSELLETLKMLKNELKNMLGE